MDRKIYPSDISREQFASINDLLENAKKKSCPRKVDIYAIFCAILYFLTEGCRWRALPGDFPPRSTVCYYVDQWGARSADEEPSLLARATADSDALVSE